MNPWDEARRRAERRVVFALLGLLMTIAAFLVAILITMIMQQDAEAATKAPRQVLVCDHYANACEWIDLPIREPHATAQI